MIDHTSLSKIELRPSKNEKFYFLMTRDSEVLFQVSNAENIDAINDWILLDYVELH